MPSKSRLYLDSYKATFMEQERLFRYRIKAWEDVMKEVVIDRGTVLGSKEYLELSGVEQASALNQIDDSLALCHDNISRLRQYRDDSIPIRYAFKNRCARLRRQISMLDDELLGKGDESV